MFSLAVQIVIQPRVGFVSAAPLDRLAHLLTAVSAAYLLARVGTGLLST